VPDFDAIARYRKLLRAPLIANHGFGQETGNAIVEAGMADAVSFARLFIANPDLVSRFALGPRAGRQRPEHPLPRRPAWLHRLPGVGAVRDPAPGSRWPRPAGASPLAVITRSLLPYLLPAPVN